MKNRKTISIFISIVVLITILVMPATSSLTVEGKNAIGITLFFLILLLTEALPLPVSCLLTIGLMPLLNITGRFYEAVVGFSHPVIFFIIASFGIANAIIKVSTSNRVLLAILRKSGSRIENVVLAIMLTTAAVSFFMSNVAVCAIMMSIALKFINLFEEGEEKKSIGKTLMIAVPVATMIGGMATPASSSLNLLAIDLLERHTGYTIAFVDWMVIGIPLVIFLTPVAWFIIIKTYKPSQISSEKIEQFKRNIHVDKKIGRKEAFVISIMAAMLILWISSSWVQGIEVFTVAVLGCVLFFLPGINVLSWDEFLPSINWDVIFISGTILTIASIVEKHNIGYWLVEILYLSHLTLNANLLVGFAALIAFISLLIITSAPALILVLSSPFITIAAANGVPPYFLIMTLAFCAGNCYLFPLDTVQLLTYSKGYYKMTDMARATIFMQIIMIIILAFWIPFMG